MRFLSCSFWLLYMRIGAFLTGIIVPREGGLAIAMTEKLEDMVAIIFLPLVCSP
jgi:Kef-type K+ transport system membrane component KefB